MKKSNTPLDMTSGTEFDTKNSGVLIVVKWHNSKTVDVKFKLTGYETTTRSSHIRNGNVKDPFYPRVANTGFFGVGDFSSKDRDLYDCWANMIKRCYDKKVQEKRPTYIGCTVCDEWHNLQSFGSWYKENYPQDGNKYHLDKDIKIKGNKVYSPEACTFVSLEDNNQEAQAKTYKMKSPSGEIVEIYNMNRFCKNNNLEVRNFSAVYFGKRRSCQGWTKA